MSTSPDFPDLLCALAGVKKGTDEVKAANVYAGTTGLDLPAALAKKAGTVKGLDVPASLVKIASSSRGTDVNASAKKVTG